MTLFIKIYAFNSKNLISLSKKIKNKLNLLKLIASGPVALPTKIHKFTVIKSPHVNKKSREQFSMSIHKQLFVIKNLDKININIIRFLILYLKSLCAENQIKITYMPGKI